MLSTNIRRSLSQVFFRGEGKAKACTGEKTSSLIHVGFLILCGGEETSDVEILRTANVLSPPLCVCFSSGKCRMC